MVVVRFKILKSDFDKVEQFCRANFEVDKNNNDFAATMIFKFAAEEMVQEQARGDDLSLNTIVDEFLKKEFEINHNKENSYIILAKVPSQIFISLLKQQKNLYPEIAECDYSVKHNFLAYLGWLFVSDLKGNKANLSKLIRHI